jgi:hypothetical protein
MISHQQLLPVGALMASVTISQGMFTLPSHLITPLVTGVSRGPCLPHSVICIYEIDECSIVIHAFFVLFSFIYSFCLREVIRRCFVIPGF